jgi:hypothetical protein
MELMMKKGKKPGEFLAQKRSHKQRQQNQDTISKLKAGEIFQGELYALNQNGMCRVIVEATPNDSNELIRFSRPIVCLAGGTHKNLHVADTLPNHGSNRCKCQLRNDSKSIVTLDLSNVFGIVLQVEELENHNGR